MKKYFLSFGLLLTVSLATVVFNSCGDDKDELQQGVTDPDNPADPNEPDPLNPTNQLLIGTWQVINSEGMDGGYPVSKTENYTVTFNSNGKGVMKEDEFEWTKKGDLLTLTYSSNSQKTVKIIKLTETELIFDSWYDSDDGSYYYTTCKKSSTNPTDPKDDSKPQKGGVVISGVEWAKTNVDAPGTFAANPEDPGMLYQWNSTTGWSATDPMVSTDGSSWNSDWKPSAWKTTNDVCPAGWRVPTNDDLIRLSNADEGVWTTINGMKGRIFGSGDSTLFLPAAGFRDVTDGSLYSVDLRGYYWSSTINSSGSRSVNFDYSEHLSFEPANSGRGFSVRCVAE